jgi:L-malate glycosyltransferase
MQRKKAEILYIGNKLAEFGYTPTTIDTLGIALEQLGYKVNYSGNVKSKISRLLQMVFSVVRNRKTTNFVLIDTYSTSAFYYAWLSSIVCRLYSKKYIPILHGGNLPLRFKRSPRLCRSVLAHSYTNVAMSSYLEQLLKENNYKSTCIPNSIPLADYRYRRREKVAPVLLWVRAFDSIYNPEMAVRVLGMLLQTFPDAHLTMVGPDKDGSMQRCIDLAVSLGIDHALKITGKLSKKEWTKIADSADVFINTSHIDNMPVSLLEAMAMGMIVVTTNVGGIKYITSANNAILVEDNDIEAMAEAIKNIIANNGEAERISIAARKNAEQYDWNNIKEHWIKLLGSSN